VSGGRTETARSWYLRRQLTQTDRFSTEDAIALLTDGTMIPHGPLTAQLRSAWENHADTYAGSDAIAADVERLLEWDGAPTLTSGTPTLFLLWLFVLNRGDVTIEVELLERAPRSLTSEDAHQMFDALKEARKRLKELVPFPPQVPWGLIHVLRKAGRLFPLESGMYPAISLMNANLDLEDPNLTKLTCRIGSAYVALHILSDPPVSYSVTPIGQTDRRDLPYTFACSELFAKRELKPLPITDAQLAAVETTTTTLHFTRQAAD
jgi:hypothetical protein